MYRNLRIIAYIPARKNSKGLKNKNLRLIIGKPLVELAILQALESKVFEQIVVSTDSEKIHLIAKKYNCITSGLRPSEIASDTSKIIDSILYDYHKLQFEDYDCLVLLQPTSPLRSSLDIKNALDLFIDNDLSSVVSVTKSNEKLHLLRTLDQQSRLTKVKNIDSDIRRQESKELLKVNGAIYVNQMVDILKSNFTFNDNSIPYIMSNENSIDIDDLNDLKIARINYRRRIT